MRKSAVSNGRSFERDANDAYPIAKHSESYHAALGKCVTSTGPESKLEARISDVIEPFCVSGATGATGALAFEEDLTGGCGLAFVHATTDQH